MFSKTPLILTLLVSLLFATQAQRVVLPVEMKPGGACASMPCVRGCCSNKVCCQVTEQQKSPQAPTPAPHYTPIQFATLDLRAYTILLIPPAPRSPSVIPDETSATHTLSPLAVNCIRLI